MTMFNGMLYDDLCTIVRTESVLGGARLQVGVKLGDDGLYYPVIVGRTNTYTWPAPDKMQAVAERFATDLLAEIGKIITDLGGTARRG